ncbi:hypothetical protein GX865_01990 [Candidatus Saccharibacteria bacterium]|jgi:hypothetical protein|nr:hypothetical protein [Candidatus Saccharibacteria bacterium]
MSESIHAIIVAGGGVDLDKSSVAARYIQNHLDDLGIPYKNVSGRESTDGHSVVRTASEQHEEMLDYIHSVEKRSQILIISQCMGTIAAHNTLNLNPIRSQNTGLVVFSPPLNKPSELLSSPTSKRRRRDDDSQMKISEFQDGHFGDFNKLDISWADIPSAYFEEANQAHDLKKHLKLSVESGRAAIVAAQNDWNQAAPQSIQEWRQVWSMQEQAQPLKNTIIIPNAGHSLNPTSEFIGHPNSTPQEEACKSVVNLGLSVLKETK